MSEQNKTILLPNRTTRGNRYKHVIRDEDIDEEQEDKEFWKQEFFQEEAKDEQYFTESDLSDIFESDFLDTEDEGDEEQGGGDDDDRPRKKTLKPPGYKQRAAALKRKRATQDDPPVPKPPQPPSASQQQLDAKYEAPSLRHSTRVKVAEAKEERRKRDTTTPKRITPKRSALKILTQEQLLAEAAATEIENTHSLQILEAVEEETKRMATVQRIGAEGPRVRYLSRAMDGNLVTTLQAVDCDPVQLSQLYAFNTHPSPPAPRPSTCFVTGRPAAYRDPRSGLPYSDAAALVELRRRIAANVPMQAARVVNPGPLMTPGAWFDCGVAHTPRPKRNMKARAAMRRCLFKL